jgi:hypothetical protein
MSEHTKKKSFLGGAAILAGAAVVIKVMGAFSASLCPTSSALWG